MPFCWRERTFSLPLPLSSFVPRRLQIPVRVHKLRRRRHRRPSHPHDDDDYYVHVQDDALPCIDPSFVRLDISKSAFRPR